jgi:hypothetical protein
VGPAAVDGRLGQARHAVLALIQAHAVGMQAGGKAGPMRARPTWWTWTSCAGFRRS